MKKSTCSHLISMIAAASVVGLQNTEAVILVSNLSSASSPMMSTGSYLATDFITGNALSTITGISVRAYNLTTLNYLHPSGGEILVGYSLYTDNGGKPGTFVPDSGFGITVLPPNLSGEIFSFTTNIALSANTIYWLVASVTDTTATIDLLNPPPAMGGPGQAPLGTGGFYAPVTGTMNQFALNQMQASVGDWSDSATTDLAFEFTGTIESVPEPAHAALVSLGSVVLILKRRRRSS